MGDGSLRHSPGPSVVLVTAGSHRADLRPLVVNGSYRGLERLGRNGTRFTDATTAGTGERRAAVALLTGRCPEHDPTSHWGDLRTTATTVADGFRSAGYRTAAIGDVRARRAAGRPDARLSSTTVDPFIAQRQAVEALGFQEVVLAERGIGWRLATTRQRAYLDDYDRFLVDRGLFGFEIPPNVGYAEMRPSINRLPEDALSSSFCTERACEWLTTHAEQPFFLWVALPRPAMPYDVPESMLSRLDQATAATAPSTRDAADPLFADLRSDREWDLYSDTATTLARAGALANARMADEQVDAIRELLTTLGRGDDTIVVATATSGDQLGDRGLWGPVSGYGASIRVPLVVSGPGFLRNEVSDAPVSHYDVAATLFAICGSERGVAASSRLGVDLRDVAIRRRVASPERGRVTIGDHALSVTRDHWKLIVYPNGGRVDLYDLRSDPDELVDRATDVGASVDRGELRDELERWLATHADGWSLDEHGGLATVPYQRPSAAPSVRALGRVPWDAREPPVVTAAGGRSVPWWWRSHGPDFSDRVRWMVDPPPETV